MGVDKTFIPGLLYGGVPKQFISLQIDEELLNEFDTACSALHYDRSEAIREAMRRFLEEMKVRLKRMELGSAEIKRAVLEEG